jgi:hypothetical protein
MVVLLWMGHSVECARLFHAPALKRFSEWSAFCARLANAAPQSFARAVKRML